jgi:hypothetical protein
VYSIIKYKPEKPWVGSWKRSPTEARRMGDKDKEKAIFAEIFIMLGKSRYSKLIAAL